MSVLQIILSVVDIISAIGIIVLFLVQEGNDQGLGAVTGATSDLTTVRQREGLLKNSLRDGPSSAAWHLQLSPSSSILQSQDIGKLNKVHS